MHLSKGRGILVGFLLAFIVAGCGPSPQQPVAEKPKPPAVIEPKPQVRAEAPAPQPYTLGQALNFNDVQVEPYLRKGWSGRESWGRWTDGPVAELRLPMDKFSTDGNYTLTLTCGLFQPDKQTVIVSLNGVPIGKIGPNPSKRDVRLPFDGKLLRQQNLIVFHIEKPVSPKELGHSDDPRKLGLGALTLAINGD